MWYVVKFSSDAAARAAAEALVGERVLAQQTTIALPFTPEFPAACFPVEEKETALTALGLHDGPTTATQNPNIRLILTKPLTVILPHGDLEELVTQVVNLFVDELQGHAVLVTNPHGCSCPPMDEDGVLHIRIYASPLPKAMNQPIPVAYGRVLPLGVRDALFPSAIGSPIAAPEAVVAEVVGRNLYILCDVSHSNDDPEVSCDLLAQILETYVERLRGADDDPEAWYIQAEERRHALRLLKARDRRKVAARKLEQAEAARVACMEDLNQAEVALHDLESRRPRTLERIRKEYLALRNLPHVRDVKVEGGSLKVKTDDEILVQFRGQSYPVGPFLIEIPLWSSGRIRITTPVPKQTDGRVFHAPHVFGDGAPCLGEFAPGIGEFLHDHDWGLAVQFIIEYLHKVNAAETASVEALTRCWTPLALPQPCRCTTLRVEKEEP